MKKMTLKDTKRHSKSFSLGKKLLRIQDNNFLKSKVNRENEHLKINNRYLRPKNVLNKILFRRTETKENQIEQITDYLLEGSNPKLGLIKKFKRTLESILASQNFSNLDLTLLQNSSHLKPLVQ